MWPYPFQQVTDRFDLSKGCSPDQRRETSLVTFIYQVLPCTKPDILNRKVKTPSASCHPPVKPAKAVKLSQGFIKGCSVSWQDSA